MLFPKCYLFLVHGNWLFQPQRNHASLFGQTQLKQGIICTEYHWNYVSLFKQSECWNRPKTV